MGTQHKLLLPWNGATVIDRVLRAWTQSLVTRVVVIVRKDDIALQDACRVLPQIELLLPQNDPEDMKRSIQLGLRQIATICKPQHADRWMVAPADLPTLSSGLINKVINAGRETESVVVPRFNGRRGHPVSFPWSLAPAVSKLSEDQGINSLVADHPVDWLDLPGDERPDDIDTPADYRRLLQQHDT